MGEQANKPNWFVGNLESFEEVRRTVYEGDAFRNKTVAVFKTPEQARLAAAAPEMLEAMQGLLSLVEELDGGEHDDAPELVAARAAIAKAEGRS